MSIVPTLPTRSGNPLAGSIMVGRGLRFYAGGQKGNGFGGVFRAAGRNIILPLAKKVGRALLTKGYKAGMKRLKAKSRQKGKGFGSRKKRKNPRGIGKRKAKPRRRSRKSYMFA